MLKELADKTSKGVKWSAIERVVTQGVQLAVMLVLANLLGPESYGLIGMLSVFIAISHAIVEGGFSNALIRKKDVNEIDFSTIYYINVIVSIICYIIIYFSAPIISEFFEQPLLVSLARFVSISIILNSLTVVHKARLTIEMDFKSQAKASLFSVLVGCSSALALAAAGAGVWALAVQTVVFSASNLFAIYFFHPWVPRRVFSQRSLNGLLPFSSRILMSSIINALYSNVYNLIIGKTSSSEQLGLFHQARLLSNTPASTLTTIIQRVTYPLFTKFESELSFKDSFLMTLKFTSFITFPLMLWLTVMSNQITSFLLGSEWEATGKYISILSLGFMLLPVQSINMNVLQVKGRSDLFLRLEILKKIILTSMLMITVPHGVIIICIGITLQSYISLLLNIKFCALVSSIKPKEQLKTIFCFLAIASISAGFSKYVSDYFETVYINIIVSIFIYIFSYLLLVRIFVKEFWITFCRVLFKSR